MAAGPLIGVTAGKQEVNKLGSVIQAPMSYQQAILRAGGIPVILPTIPGGNYAPRILGIVHGLVLTGGDEDVDPSCYGEPMCGTRTVDKTRDRFELSLLDHARELRLPFLGICRGLHLVNVLCKGTVRQHIHGHELQQTPSEHDVTLYGMLEKLYGTKQLWVNSFHHQGVDNHVLADSAQVLAASVDGIIEGLCIPNWPSLAVQWHPESLFDTDAAHLAPFRWIVEQASQYAMCPQSVANH